MGESMNQLIETTEWDVPVRISYRVVPNDNPYLDPSIEVINISLTPKGYKLIARYHADLAAKGIE